LSLYPPPREVNTRVFTELPREFRTHDGKSDWGAAHRPGQRLDSFLEGPSFDPIGNLYVTDIPYGRIFRISPAGRWELVVQYDGWPNGSKIHRDGRIFIADYRRGILALDPKNGAVTPLLTHRNSESFKGVNDLTFDARGRLYFTDQGQSDLHDPTGRVFSYDLDTGRLDCLLANGPGPNGLVLNVEENVLYVGMTRGNAIWRLPLLPDGGTSKVGVFTQLAGGVSGADGLTIDENGNVYVADAGNGCVWVFTPYAEPLYRIRSCTSGRTLTNLAFGGDENRTLFMTDSSTGTILYADLETPGKRLYSHQ
jgi:gluconolactonase